MPVKLRLEIYEVYLSTACQPSLTAPGVLQKLGKKTHTHMNHRELNDSKSRKKKPAQHIPLYGNLKVQETTKMGMLIFAYINMQLLIT